jgi:hypothetical protein
MSRLRQVVLIRLVSGRRWLAVLYRISYTRLRCAEAVQERPGTGIGVRSKGRYQRGQDRGGAAYHFVHVH